MKNKNVILIPKRNIPANRATTTGQNGCRVSAGMFLIGISIKKSILLILAVSVAFSFSGCSLAQTVPEGYLTDEYYAAIPVLSPVVGESQPVDGAGTVTYNRTLPEPEKPKTGKPPKVVVITAAATSASTSSTASAASSSTELETYTYKKTDLDDKKETLGNVEIAAPDVELENKYIKGDLTVTKDAYGSLTLTNCKIDGDVIVKGDLDSLDIVDTTVEMLYLYSGYDITVSIEGRVYVKGTFIKGTDVNLQAYNISSNYSGYNVITVERYTRADTIVNLLGVECITFMNESTSEVTFDNDSSAERFIATAATTVYGADRISLFTARCSGIILHGQPDKIVYDEKKYDSPTLTD